MIDTSRQERARFAFESELLTRLDHPALPRVYRSFEDETNNRSYMLMDFIEGPNLETLRQKQPQKRFPLSQVMSMMAPIVQAISYLHKQRPPIINPDIPVHVSDAIQRAMAINIEDRFPSADQFWQALNAQPAQPMTPVPPMVTPLAAANNAPIAPDEHEPVTPEPQVPGAANKTLN